MNAHTLEEEKSITHIWERFNPRWLMIGAISGILAGFIVLGVASVLSAKSLGEFTQVAKLLGSTFFGTDATAFGSLGVAGLTGILFHLFLSALFGITFAQLVCERSTLGSLLALGLATSFIIWVFGWKLFLPSFNRHLALMTPSFYSLFLHFLFGILFAFFLNATRQAIARDLK